MEHQKNVIGAQLKLAGEFQRAVSVHGVQAHGVVFEALQESWKGHKRKLPSRKELKRRKANNDGSLVADQLAIERLEEALNGLKPFPPRICLHSYSGPAETVNQYLDPSTPADIYFSFSSVINFSTTVNSKVEAVIRVLPADRILSETDLHTAGDRLDDQLEDIIRKICRLKGWSLLQGVKAAWRQLAQIRIWRFVLV